MRKRCRVKEMLMFLSFLYLHGLIMCLLYLALYKITLLLSRLILNLQAFLVCKKQLCVRTAGRQKAHSLRAEFIQLACC